MEKIEVCLRSGGPSDFTGGLLFPRAEEAEISSRRGEGGRWMYTDTFATIAPTRRDIVYWRKGNDDVFIHVVVNESGGLRHSQLRVQLSRVGHSFVRPLQYTLGWLEGALGHGEYPVLTEALQRFYREHQLPVEGYERYEEN